MVDRKKLRDRWMHSWWAFWPGKSIRVQNTVARLGCLLVGHDFTRYRWCDWCGAERKGRGHGD